MIPRSMSGLDRSADVVATRRTALDPSDVAASWSSATDLVMASAQGDEPVTGGAAVGSHTEDDNTRATPSISVGAGPFDLPAFLQVLPKAGIPAAVAAGRDPAMAQALRRLPEVGAIGERRSGETRMSLRPIARQELPQQKLPLFLVTAVATSAVHGLPGTAVTTPAASQAAATGNPFSFDASGLPGEPIVSSDAAEISGSPLSEAVGSDAWQDQLGARLSVMATAGGESEAVIKLAPEGLGELEIRVLVRDGEASLQFGASNADARQAIEVAQPRLRELFTSQGLDITNFSVSNNLTGNPQYSSKDGDSHPRPGRSAPVAQDGVQVRVSIRAPQGIVDTYA